MNGLGGARIAVTGAAGGVGHAVSQWLTARGATVFDLDVRPPAEPVGSFVAVDVTDPVSVADAASEVLRLSGRVDGLVVAAGVSEEPTPAEGMDVATFDRTISVNLRGVFLTCQAFGRVMLEQGQGRIVTIGSMSGNHVVNKPQQQVAYNASKAGVVALTKSLAVEWAPRGVRVNALSPGYIDTPLLASKSFLHQQWKDATPAARFATPEEIAAATGWLLSDDAAFCVGTELLMDGGYSLC